MIFHARKYQTSTSLPGVLGFFVQEIAISHMRDPSSAWTSVVCNDWNCAKNCLLTWTSVISCDFASVILGYPIGVFHICMLCHWPRLWVVYQIRLRSFYYLCMYPSYNIVGLYGRSIGWGDDSNILGIFCKSSFPSIYKSSGDGHTHSTDTCTTDTTITSVVGESQEESIPSAYSSMTNQIGSKCWW